MITTVTTIVNSLAILAAFLLVVDWLFGNAWAHISKASF